MLADMQDSLWRRPLIDHRGVDRVQIRRLLRLSPLDRIRRMNSVLEGLLRIRRLNGKHAPR